MNLAIFDIDGTLTATDAVDGECFVLALADALAINDVNTHWAQYPHTTDSGITAHIFRERFGREPSVAEVTKLQIRFIELLKTRRGVDVNLFAEINGAAAALDRLERDAAWAVALATGCWHASAALKLEAAGIEYRHLPAAFAEDGLSREEIVRAAHSRALSRHGVQKFERVVSVGDGVWDVRAARRLELPFLGVGNGERETTLRLAGASHVVKDFADYDFFAQSLCDARTPSPPADDFEAGESERLSLETLRESYDRVAADYAAEIYDELKDKPLDRELLDRFAVRVRDRGTACD
ncbi:MAG: HAD family hydrolase, partial [Pyrinomonadaceae bacterium]